MNDLPISAETLELLSSLISSLSSMISGTLALALFLVMGIGLHRMSKACGLKAPWLGWIPFGQSYALGRLADHQCSVNEDNPTTYRRALLTFHILQTVSAVLAGAVTLGIYMVDIFEMAFDGTLEVLMADPVAYANAVNDLLLAAYGKAWFFWLIMVGIAITYTVFYAIAVYKISKLFQPKQAVLYTVLVVLPVVQNVAQIIFFLRMATHKPLYVNQNDLPPSEGGEDLFYTL